MGAQEMEAQGSEFLEESPWWGRREPGVFCAVSEWVGLLLMEKTIRAGGGLQVPFPGLLSGCSAIPEPSPCHPKPFIFLVLHTFIWNKRDPFPNQGLKICHLDRSIINTQDPSQTLCQGITVLRPSRDEGITPTAPHCVGGSSGA